jgi:hypothetical protein
MYIFAIVFKVQLGDHESEDVVYKFGTIGDSMWCLLLNGVFLDNITDVGDLIKEASPTMAAIFIFFVIISAVMVMNMLIGILCEVISAVAETEKEKLVVNFVKSQLLDVLAKSDRDGDGLLNKAEFTKLLEEPQAQKAIEELGVDASDMEDLADRIFEQQDKPNRSSSVNPSINDEEGKQEEEEEKEPAMDFADFMEMLLTLRASNPVSVAHIMDLRKSVKLAKNQTQDKMKKMNMELMQQIQMVKAELYEIKTGEKPPESFNVTLKSAGTMNLDATIKSSAPATKEDVANLQKSIEALRMELASRGSSGSASH